MMLAEVTEEEIEQEQNEMPSFNHSYICLEILLQLAGNPKIKPLPELTLEIDEGSLTPDISVYAAEDVKPDFLRDIPKYPEMPILAIEIISASQNIQDLLEKAEILLRNGVKAVWTIEPFTNTIFVSTKQEVKRLQNQQVKSEGIEVDFRKIFGSSSN